MNKGRKSRGLGAFELMNEDRHLVQGAEYQTLCFFKSCPALCLGNWPLPIFLLNPSGDFESLINNLETCFSGVEHDPVHAVAKSKARKNATDE